MHIRKQLEGPYAANSLSTQCGGIKSRGPDTAQHFARTVWDLAHHQGVAAFHLYVDVCSAFASMSRELVYQPIDSDEGVAAFMSKFNIPPRALPGGT